jgi:branched-chain amino acid transport system substrate-binding protein
MTTPKTISRAVAVLLAAALLAAACSGDDGEDTGATPEPTPPVAEPAAPPEPAPAEPAPPPEEPAPAPEPAPPPAPMDLDVDAILAADLANCAPAPQGEPLRIGYAADFSELGGFVDIPAASAAEYFVELVNCWGGVDGHPVEMVIRDIEGDPETAGRVAQELVDEDVTAILGPAFFDVNQAILQITAGNVPLISVSSTEPLLADASQLSFLASFTDTAQAVAAAEFAISQGWTTAATFSVPGPYFGYVVEVFTETFESLGGEVLGDYPFVPVQTTDFSAQVNEIAALDPQPDVVYSALLAFQAAILGAQLSEATVGSEMLIADAFTATGGYFVDGVEGFFHTSHTFPDPDGRMLRFLGSYEAVKGATLESDSYSALAADAILVIADAVIRSGSLDPVTVGEAITAGTGVDGLTGTLVYDGGATPNTPVYVHEVVDGQPTLAAVYG